jgi:hypothetical protein
MTTHIARNAQYCLEVCSHSTQDICFGVSYTIPYHKQLGVIKYPKFNPNPVVEKELDINRLVLLLPTDILVKIYNDYFRPHKFLQLYTALVRPSTILREICIVEFKRHLVYFMHEPIRTFISKTDPRLFVAWSDYINNPGLVFDFVFTVLFHPFSFKKKLTRHSMLMYIEIQGDFPREEEPYDEDNFDY